MIRAEPWQTAEIPGPLKALIVQKPTTAAGIIKHAKRPLMILGSKIFKIASDQIVDALIQISKTINVQVVVTSGLIKEFEKKGYKVGFMPAMELADRLRDDDWCGLDGKGNYDLAVFIGFQYYYGWLILSGLKHFSREGFKTMSLDPYYQPHATFSLYNMKKEDWCSYILTIRDSLKG
ncbi:MAG TPA: CO dehydrogenase/acetyl-CoA synthase complex subunit epsilon [Candidatus Korarchaeota archaeon]|nr:CO dehydrogenase/acetyl-CoA synthase complex subunit epsilon [Candidatus Korarchaeota archaeon]